MSNLISINSDSLKRYGRLLRAASPGVIDRVEFGLRSLAAETAAEARSRSGWSSRIPGSVRSGGTKTRAYVRAGGAKAPHAPAYEHHGREGNFRHPVFGDRNVWVDEPARPFLSPSVDRIDAERIATAIAKYSEEL